MEKPGGNLLISCGQNLTSIFSTVSPQVFHRLPVENLITCLITCGKLDPLSLKCLWKTFDRSGALKSFPQVFHSFSTGFPQGLWKTKSVNCLIIRWIIKKWSSFPQRVVKHRTCGTVENLICGKSEPDLWKTCGKLLTPLESL